MSIELETLLAWTKAKVDAMSPAELSAIRKAQRRSFLLAEAGFGSDADEAAYAAALRAGDTKTLARLNAESEARRARAAALLDNEDHS